MFELLGNVGGLMESARLTAEEDAFMESFDGYDCPYDDVDEATLYTAMESQQNFNNLMQAVALQEMNYYMTYGEEMVYEAVDFKGFFGKIKAVILKAWEKIKGIFHKIFSTIDGWIRSDAGYIKKYEKDMKEAEGTTIDFKGYAIKQFDPFININEAANKYSKEYMEKFNFNSFKDGYEEELKSVISAMSGTEAENKEEYIKWLKKQFGLDDKVTIKKYNSAVCIQEIRDAKLSKKNAKDSYERCKKLWGALAKLCDQMANKAIKDMRNGGESSKDKEKEINKAAAAFSKMCNTANSLGHSALNINIKAINVAHSQAKSMTVKAIAKKKKEKDDKKDEKSTNESFMDFDLI